MTIRPLHWIKKRFRRLRKTSDTKSLQENSDSTDFKDLSPELLLKIFGLFGSDASKTVFTLAQVNSFFRQFLKSHREVLPLLQDVELKFSFHHSEAGIFTLTLGHCSAQEIKRINFSSRRNSTSPQELVSKTGELKLFKSSEREFEFEARPKLPVIQVVQNVLENLGFSGTCEFDRFEATGNVCECLDVARWLNRDSKIAFKSVSIQVDRTEPSRNFEISLKNLIDSIEILEALEIWDPEALQDVSLSRRFFMSSEIKKLNAFRVITQSDVALFDLMDQDLEKWTNLKHLVLESGNSNISHVGISTWIGNQAAENAQLEIGVVTGVPSLFLDSIKDSGDWKWRPSRDKTGDFIRFEGADASLFIKMEPKSAYTKLVVSYEVML